MSKKNRQLLDQSGLYNSSLFINRNKYYNLFFSMFKWDGEIDYRQIQFIMNRFWADGTVAAFKIKNIDELGFASWAKFSIDMYGLPEQLTLVNQFSSPLVPQTVQTVDKDVVIGYLQSNNKSLYSTVDWYCKRIAQIECIINTNLELQKMPFLIPVEDDTEMSKINDIISKILNNELVIGVNGISPATFKAIQTGAPFIIDKLVNHKRSLENELKTIMGIDNAGDRKIEQENLAATNANNGEIQSYRDNMLSNLKDFCKRVKETFGITISVETNAIDVEPDGEIHEMELKTGPRGDENNED